MPDNQMNDWAAWRNHVLERLKEMSEANKELSEAYVKLATEVAGLQVKAGIWGLLGGLIPALGFFLISFFLKRS